MQHRPTITTALALTIVAACAAAFGSPSAARAAGHGPGCDNGTIVFSRFDQNGIPNLFATNPCGGAVAQITTAGGHHPDISQDGRLLAYDSIGAGQSTTDVFLSSSEGTGPRNITNSPATNDIQPDLSPDGKSVAYSSGTAGERNARIVVQDLRSGEAHAITPAVPGQEAFDPSWSPSGLWITFDTYSATAGLSYLWVVRSDGAGLRRITDDAADACQPDWGPQGLIAYAGGCDQLQSHLYIRDLFGVFARQLTTDADGGSSQLPAFSPDGASLTFSRFDAAFNDGDVWRLDLRTGVQTDLVSGPTFDLWSVWGPARS
jgi:TolB protein